MVASLQQEPPFTNVPLYIKLKADKELTAGAERQWLQSSGRVTTSWALHELLAPYHSYKEREIVICQLDEPRPSARAAYAVAKPTAALSRPLTDREEQNL